MTTDQWIARGLSIVGLGVAAVASAFQFSHPIVATLLLTFGALLFILALWIAARNRVRWLDPVFIVVCLLALGFSTYRLTQLRAQAHSTATSASESGDSESQHRP